MQVNNFHLKFITKRNEPTYIIDDLNFSIGISDYFIGKFISATHFHNNPMILRNVIAILDEFFI